MQLSLVNSSDKRGSTMIELIAMMAIMALGISSMLGVIGSWVDFAKNTEDNIKAINLAREGIEGVTNLRDTNWLRFSSDKNNCWKTVNYNGNCIGNSAFSNTILSGSYLLYSTNWAWFLSGMSTSTTLASDWSNWASYKIDYHSWLDVWGFFSQTWSIPIDICSSSLQTNCLTIFTREIQIIVPSTDTWTLNVSSVVRWWGKSHHEVRLDTTITNWKSKF